MRTMTIEKPVAPRPRALAALRRGLEATRPGLFVDGAGYVSSFEDNLLSGVEPEDFVADMRGGSGRELDGKFRAAHSSSALGVNTFAPFRRRLADLAIAGDRGFDLLAFERKCPTGIQPGAPPNLDMLLERESLVIGIESKCTEYLSPHAASFSDAYEKQIRDARRDGRWFGEMLRLREAPRTYRWLDVAQLIKHAFGLAHTYPDRRTLLLYLFWEPPNAADFPLFGQHREEIADFADQVSGSPPLFAALSYRELWKEWDEAASPGWLRDHLQALKARYDVPM